jgi:hypothetical protein
MPSEMDYASMLLDMEAKRAALDAAISSLRVAITSGALGQGGSLPPDQSGSVGQSASAGNGGMVDIPSGAFLGKSMPDAIKAFLGLVRKKQTTREITEALKVGGIESKAKKFAGNVSAVLFRLARPGGGIVKIQDAWGLAEWYPAGFRPTTEKAVLDGRNKARRAAAARVKALRRKKAHAKLPSTNQTTRKERIVGLMKSDQDKDWTATEIADTLSDSRTSVQSTMSVMGQSGELLKSPLGYRLPKQKAA